jgi:hypothetical protein
LWLAGALLCLERPSLAAQTDLPIRAARLIGSILPEAATYVTAPIASTLAAHSPLSGPQDSIRFDDEIGADPGAYSSYGESIGISDSDDAGGSWLPEMQPAESEPPTELDDENPPALVGVQSGQLTHVRRSPRDVPPRVGRTFTPATADTHQPPPSPAYALLRSPTTFTATAGLFFAVPIMERLGIAEWLANERDAIDWNLPGLVLRTIARRAGASVKDPVDPVILAIGELPEEPPARVLILVNDWMRQIRRRARLSARIGLRSLIRRPGQLRFTATHIDVFFGLGDADMRIRRAGLDIDPGWTPWLGRVIRYHYSDDEAADG